MSKKKAKDGINVLMIEDDTEFVDDFRRLSFDGKFPRPRIDREASAEAALEKLTDKSFFTSLDMILVDLKLGLGKSGIAFLEELRLLSGYGHVRTVVLTDLDAKNIIIGGKRHDQRELKSMGVSRILSKSIVFDRDIEDVYELLLSDSKDLTSTVRPQGASFVDQDFALFKAGLAIAVPGATASFAGLRFGLPTIALAGSVVLATGLFVAAFAVSHGAPKGSLK